MNQGLSLEPYGIMKKEDFVMSKFKIKLFACIFSMLLLSVTLAYGANETTQPTINVGTGEDQIQYVSKLGGEQLGPQSFSLKSNGGYYLLDTAKNRVISFDPNGNKDDLYKLPDDFYAAHIATGKNDEIYLLDVSKSTIGVFKSGGLERIEIIGISTECLIDFNVTETGVPYIVLFVNDSAESFLFSIINCKANIIEQKNGRLMPDGTIYKTELIKDNGSNVGHAAKVSIYDFRNKLQKSVTVKSKHWIEGISYLGKYDGNLFLKIHEMESDGQGNVYFEDIVKEVDNEGNIKGILDLPKKYKYNLIDTIAIDRNIYHLNTNEKKVTIDKLKLQSPDTYSSDLDGITPDATSLSTNVGIQSLSTVKRSLIQSTVKSYWSWTWYCSQSNYNTINGSTRPRYITAPNQNYQCVPYCWGDWDTLTQFQTNQGNGMTCGNINTSGFYISGTCGVDCAGYVQRCWGINDYKRACDMFGDVSYVLESYSDLIFGDALNDPEEHIMIYEKPDGYGNYVLYEATKLNSYDRVAHTTRTISYCQSYYDPIRRYNIDEDI